ncbi:MAG: hypothetical protein Ct9H300mP28_04270 [Pseudomonadota bacterium]|nr:MAG: hypothetical protein Ct9H300mP28_04270 [Pseudomonadota bacterium]
MGISNALLVAIAIPLSFLASMIILNVMGFTLNIVVLFSLILSLDCSLISYRYSRKHLPS